ncbi:alpha/beta hydrolase family protein [Actinomadura xylanilytica]|uniref:alpha/beta hydrolase family protein n=1 Tax=Actinomadura xylanilytica TaxID=887459 RepID=UPI00255AD180|nr:lipase [Actinomadura xylanilytica]MDL4773076.1 lipase [Actinomadura xylanilytica]
MSARTRGLIRRPARGWALAAAGTAGLVLATAGVAVANGHGDGPATASAAKAALTAAGEQKGRVELKLPAPSGPRRIGTTSLHLVDRSRRDPWVSSRSPRELMVSVWYPAGRTQGLRRAAWLPPASLELYRKETGQTLQIPMDDVDFPTTHAFQDAPAEARAGGNPVVLFSPGYGGQRALNTSLVEDLASRGYVVVTIDHTYETPFVEFPGGRLEFAKQPSDPSEEDYAKALRVREADTKFVLNQLTKLNAGKNPDAEHRRLPQGLRGGLDLARTGMFGHSLGGDTAAEVMAQDRRIRAGVDLDGSIIGPVKSTGLDRPFMLMGNATHGRDNDSSWEDFWANLRGWRLDLRLRDSAHHTYTDLSPLSQQIAKARPLSPQVIAKIEAAIGTVDADRAVAAQRAYLGAFFDLHLRHRDGDLLKSPSPRYPEIEFIP